jgi:methionine synthase II (cobalamin-independent)
MATNVRVDIPRSDVVGSLLRPVYLREMRQAVREGRASEAELHTAVEAHLREATQ